MRFSATLELHGKTATGIRVPPEIVAALGPSKRPPVRVTLAGHAYRSTVAARGDAFLLPVSAEHRAAAGVEAGDEVDVELELDSEPREVAVPPDLAAALEAEPEARQFLAGLSPSQQKWFAQSVEEAKKPETRQRRVDKAVAMLREGRAR
jgi:bacteriocin resistance YdeI/OmpD-like protein/uncharacterized protein DUF1905